MKQLSQYILEAYEVFRLNTVTAKYNCNPEDLYIQAPETYQESDVQQYIDDKLINELPAGPNYAEKFFGKNAKNIVDVYFEYDGFEHLEEDKEDTEIHLKWDPKYNTTNAEVELDIFVLKNIKYVITFDGFELLDNNDNNINSVLNEIFKATISNDQNKYPINISIEDKNIDYSK